MRTTLNAVNEILEAIGEPPATGTDTGGTSDVAKAESTLNREGRKIQAMGWYVNEENNIELKVSTDKIIVTGTPGTFEYGETVTETTSGATGEFQELVTESSTVRMYLVKLTGTFTGGRTLTGGTSGATATGSTRATTDRIVLHDDFLKVMPHEVKGVISESAKFVRRHAFLYDTENNTYAWTSSVQVDRVVLQTFTLLPEQLADYIIKVAAVKFQRSEKRGQLDDAYARDEMTAAMLESKRWDSDLRRINLLTAPGAIAVKGTRKHYINPTGE